MPNVRKQAVVNLKAYRSPDLNTCGQISAEPFSDSAVTLLVTGQRTGTTVLTDVALDDLEEFVRLAREACEAIEWCAPS